MSKKAGTGDSAHKLPQELRSLITRKLDHLRKEQDGQWSAVLMGVYAKLQKEMKRNSADWKMRGHVAVPVEVYIDIVEHAFTTTKKWPGIVWEATKSILEKSTEWPLDSHELDGIVDEHAWSVDQPPFTHEYIDPNKFQDNITLAASSYGLETPPTCGRGFALLVTAGSANIINTARQAREGVGIAIAEFVLAHRQNSYSPPSSRPAKISIQREANKLATKALHERWHKKYLEFKREKPDDPDTMISKKIAKLDIAQGCSAETIRKKMKKK